MYNEDPALMCFSTYAQNERAEVSRLSSGTFQAIHLPNPSMDLQACVIGCASFFAGILFLGSSHCLCFTIYTTKAC